MKNRIRNKGLKKAVFTVCGLFLFGFYGFSQTVDAETKSIKPDSVSVQPPALALPELPATVPGFPYLQSLPGLEMRAMINSEGIRVVPQNLQLQSPFRSPYLYRSGNTAVGPFRYSYQNWIQGGDIIGIRAAHQFSDRFFIAGNANVSNSYFGMIQPTRQWNAGINVNSGYWVTDWMMVYGYGQYSVNNGPMLSPHSPAGGAKAYGGGMQIKITEHFGVGMQVNREYWMGKWRTTYNYYPVIY